MNRKRSRGREKSNPTWNFAKEITEDGTSFLKCIVEGCPEKFKGLHIGNLERHISRNHFGAFKAICEEKMQQEKEKDPESASKKRKVAPLLSLRMSMTELKEACVSLVTVSGRPFSLMNDPGFQKIVKPLINAMPTEQREAISAESVRKGVSRKADEIKKQLRCDLRNKLICLKIDACTRKHRSFLGVNAQFIEKGQIHLRTLAVKEVFVRQTASNIKELLLEILWDLDLTPKNVYSITSDNGGNMILAGQLLGEETNASTEEAESEEDPDDVEEMEDSELAPVDDAVTALPESAICAEGDQGAGESSSDSDHGHGGTLGDAEGCMHACQEVVITDDGLIIKCVRCASHTLQLAVDDTLKQASVKGTIAVAARLCRLLRTRNIGILLKTCKLRRPVLLNDTRWHSTHDMLESLLPLKNFTVQFSSNLKSVRLPAQFWKNVEAIVAALQPAKIAAKSLQAEQLLMGDFFGLWLKCKLKTSKVDTPCARLLVRNMESREDILFSNDAFLGAVYLDPRYSSMLTPASAAQAEAHLLKVWERLERLKLAANSASGTALAALAQSPVAAQSSSSNDEDDEAEELDLFLASKYQSRLSNVGAATRTSILPLLKTFSAGPRLKPSADLLQYWEARRYGMPELYELARVVLSVPATQVSVERTFSGVRFILSDLRMNLGESVVSDIMAVRYYSISTAPKQASKLSRRAEMSASAAVSDLEISSSSESEDGGDEEVEGSAPVPVRHGSVHLSSESSDASRSPSASADISRSSPQVNISPVQVSPSPSLPPQAELARHRHDSDTPSKPATRRSHRSASEPPSPSKT